MQNFVAQTMRRAGLAPKNKETARTQTPSRPNLVGNAPLSHLEIDGRWSYSTLQYPLDIQSRSDLGHYMMFYINVPVETKYGENGGLAGKGHYSVGVGNKFRKAKPDPSDKFGKPKAKRDPAQDALNREIAYSEGGTSTGSLNDDGRSFRAGQTNKVIGRRHHQGTTADLLGKKRTTRTNDAIVLYMPPQIVMNTMAQYKESEIGSLIGQAAGAIQENRAATGDAAGKEAISDTATVISNMFRDMAKKSFAASGNDVVGAQEKMNNIATNNFLEVMFGGVGFRKFSYTWKFSPKTPQESDEIDKIIRTFRFHMLPEKKAETLGRFYVLPSEFDIFYMFRGEENTWFNKISSCVLINADVNYAPNGYQTFRPHEGRNGAPPTEIDLKLDFMETKLITKEDVLEGF